MKGLLLVAIVYSALFTLPAPVIVHGSDPVAALAWMAGCWRQAPRGVKQIVVDEQWMPPLGGTMLGMSRTVSADSILVELEHLQILVRNGAIVYHAEPSGQRPADFTAVSVSDSLVTFSNPAHEYPQRIIYMRRGADSLLARVEGRVGGRERGTTFSYARTTCGGVVPG
jgi:hypothetical protein